MEKKKYNKSSTKNFITLKNVDAAGVAFLFLVCLDTPTKDIFSFCSLIYNQISISIRMKIHTQSLNQSLLQNYHSI